MSFTRMSSLIWSVSISVCGQFLEQLVARPYLVLSLFNLSPSELDLVGVDDRIAVEHMVGGKVWTCRGS